MGHKSLDRFLSNVAVALKQKPEEYRGQAKSPSLAVLVNFFSREKTALEKFLPYFGSVFMMQKILVMFKEQGQF